jgi:hypothetical protein
LTGLERFTFGSASLFRSFDLKMLILRASRDWSILSRCHIDSLGTKIPKRHLA